MKTKSTENLLKERGKTHGDFTDTAAIIQKTKDLWRNHPGWAKLSAVQCEALEMNAHKVGRILCGNPDVADHWDDISGYSKLASQRIK